MAKAVAKGEIPVSSDKLWALVADFGNVGWIQGAGDVKTEGSGPGMVRFLGEKGEIQERLESVDVANKTLVYTIPVGIPFPVTDYRATMVVSSTGPDTSELEWSCEMKPKGVSDQEAVAMLEGMYNTMIGWIRDYLS